CGRLLSYVQTFDTSLNLWSDGPRPQRLAHRIDVDRCLLRRSYYGRTFEHRVAIATVECDECRRGQRILLRIVERQPVHLHIDETRTRTATRIERKLHAGNLRKTTRLGILSTAADAVFQRRSQRCASDFDLNQFVLERQDRQEISLRQPSRTDEGVGTNRAAVRETDVSAGRLPKCVRDEVADVRFLRAILFAARVECDARAPDRLRELGQ